MTTSGNYLASREPKVMYPLISTVRETVNCIVQWLTIRSYNEYHSITPWKAHAGMGDSRVLWLPLWSVLCMNRGNHEHVMFPVCAICGSQCVPQGESSAILIEGCSGFHFPERSKEIRGPYKGKANHLVNDRGIHVLITRIINIHRPVHSANQ